METVNFEIKDLESRDTDLLDTAASIRELDLIVTVDSMTAHLSGALARPTYTLLVAQPDWRWMLNRSDTPWYPTMRLFRQSVPGDWSGPVAEVVEAVKGSISIG